MSTTGREPAAIPATAQSPIAAPDSIPGVAASCTDFRTHQSVSIRAQHLLSDGTIAQGWTPDGTRLCLGAVQGVSSAAIADGSGGAIVVWVDNRTEDGDLYAQHFRSNRTLAPGWSEEGVPICTARGSQYRMALTSDGGGGAIVVWQDFRSGVAGDIYAQRVTAAGQVAWAPDGVPVCVDPTDQAAPTIAADGAGGALVVWQDRRGGEPQLYLQHLSPSGTPTAGLPDSGLRVVPTAQTEMNPAMVCDSIGGAFLVWEDARGGSAQLYATRLTFGGSAAAGWPALGTPVGASAGEQHAPALASDGVGGIIVAWSEQTVGRSHVTAQRLSAAGSIGWGAAGDSVCMALGGQSSPAIVADGAGGAIVGWEDHRAGLQSDLYAQRLAADGTRQWQVVGVPICIAAGNQRSLSLTPDGTGGAIASWCDAGGAKAHFFPSRLVFAGPVPKLEAVKADPSRVRLMWRTTPHDARDYFVARQSTPDEWVTIAQVHADGEGALIVVDEQVAIGEHFEYRLLSGVGEAEIILGQVGATIPPPKPLALTSARWDRSVRAIRVALTLATREPARIELFDVMGRRMVSDDLGSPGPGDYDIQLATPVRLSSGVYFVRLTQGRAERTGKAVVLR